jgi:molybdate transport system ATP-binding protein
MLRVDTKLQLGEFNHQADFSAGSELVVIFGPSGAGKSLTLSVLAGLTVPDSGLIQVGDRVFFDSSKRINLPPQKRRVGYVFQEYALFPHLTVAGNIAFGLPKLSRQEKAERVDEMLSLMRLERLGDSYPHQISGGQRQRTALARALAFEPSVLLLDEPFSALDSAVREKLRLDILRIKERLRIPIVFVTHDLEEAYMLADRMVVFDKGRVRQVGTRDEIFYKPADRTVARFVGAKNIFSGRVDRVQGDDCRLQAELFALTAPRGELTQGQEIEFCIRPEDIIIVRPDRAVGRRLEKNILSGAIASVSHRGAIYQLEWRLGGGDRSAGAFDFTIRLPAHAYRRLELEVGRPADISVKKESIHVLASNGKTAEPQFSAIMDDGMGRGL